MLKVVAKLSQVNAFVPKRPEKVLDVFLDLERRRENAFSHPFRLLVEEELEEVHVDLLALPFAVVIDLLNGGNELFLPSIGFSEGFLGQLLLGEGHLVITSGVRVVVLF